MNLKSILFLTLLSPLVLSPTLAFADDDREGIAGNLGWIAVGSGVIANIPFIVINKIRRFSVNTDNSLIEIAKQIGTVYKPVLNFHIMLNAIGYFAGMMHGLMLSRHVDFISLSLVIVMTVMMISGLLLKYTSSRSSKIFNKILHGQFGLVLVLAALVVLHVATSNE